MIAVSPILPERLLRLESVLDSAQPCPSLFEPATLIVRIAEHRDRAAFQALFLHYAPRVKTYLLRHGAPAERAEDLAQETLLSIWRKADQYDPARASAGAWIFAIARNLRIDALRREQSALAYSLAGPEPEDPGPTPDTEQQASEREALIREAVKVLPAEQLQVVRLSFFADKAHAEIAKDLGLPLGTVKSRLRLALGRLRTVIGDRA